MKVPLFSHKHQLYYGNKSDQGYSLESIAIDKAPQEDIDSIVTIELINSKNVIVIDSTKSGVGRNQRDIYKPLLKPILDIFLVVHTYVDTTSADTVTELANSLKSGDYSIIIISGDTSVTEFVNGLPQHQKGTIKINLIPFGTGNSLALSLGIENEFIGIQKLLKDSPHHPLNLYRAEIPANSWLLHEGAPIKPLETSIEFLVVLSWGFHASLVADSDTKELRKHGLDRFKMAAMKNLKAVQEYDATTIIGNDCIINGPYAYWLVTPSRRFEPTFEILPKGDIFESSLYLVAFKTEVDNDNYIMDIMTQVYNQGSHINNPKVTYKKITDEGLILKFNDLAPDKRRFCIDGTIVQVPEGGEIRIKPCNNKKYDWQLMISA